MEIEKLFKRKSLFLDMTLYLNGNDTNGILHLRP